MPPSLHPVDLVIILVYLALLAGIGIYFSRQKDLESFFVARGSFGWLPVGLSLMAALNSGLDYLMQPSSTIRYGVILLVGPLSWLFLYPWVSRVTLPFYRRLNLYTAYEFLEERFDVRVRTLAAAIFIVWRLGWMATALYVPCLAINAVFGGRLELSTMIVVLGVLVTLYTMLGGIQAVVWNDVVQFFIMFGGLAATVWISATHGAGSLSAIVAAAHEAGHQTAVATASGGVGLVGHVRAFFAEPINGTAILVATVVGRMAGFTSDQVMVQRFQTTTSVREARRAFVVNAVSDAFWMIGLSFVGLALLAYFQRHALPVDFATDKIVPYFMSQAFPAGATGLVIAAILAASLSSIDSAVNASTSVVVIDFYRRLVRGDSRSGAADADEAKRQLLISRLATVLFGLAGTYLATNVARIGGLLEIANKLINAFTGPLFGIYVLAMFSTRATSGPVLIAGVSGSLVSYFVAYHSAIGFMWPSTFGLVATLAIGWLFSAAIGTRPQSAALRFTWSAIMRRRDEANEPSEHNPLTDGVI
jgi:SSS family transporter